jgi:hypothetical protein
VVEGVISECRLRGLEPSTLGSMVDAAGAVKTAWFRN